MPLFDEFSEICIVPRFNVAPSQLSAVIRLNKDAVPKLGAVKWGLIPSWTKGKPQFQPINAKAETVAGSAMFRAALERRRCLVPADGFYEWQGAKAPKQPFFIRRKDDEPFAFAGLWERWQENEDATPIDTFTIITTTPNELMKSIHARMPVILDQSDYEQWLDREQKAADVIHLLKPHDAAEMEAYKVGTKVNKPVHDDPELCEPLKT